MGSKTCLNELCRATTSHKWKKGWGLKSGRFATLCYTCGHAYENLVFCETFHLEDSGWRLCKLCGKHIHCGCIASKYEYEFLESGGVACVKCAKLLETLSTRPHPTPDDDMPNGFTSLKISDSCDPQSSAVENRVNQDAVENGRVMQFCKPLETNEPGGLFHSQEDDADVSSRKINQQKIVLPIGEDSRGFSNLLQQPLGPSAYTKLDNSRSKPGVKDMFESSTHPSLSFSLSTPLDNINSGLSFSGTNIDGQGLAKVPSLQQGQTMRHITPKPVKNGQVLSFETNKRMPSEVRIARPPAEGRGRQQLLPRYWPRITDKELQQLSGDLNSTIVPLFEKVLSASDAGRIGRLVLPKACAEAYFPSISQSDGVPIKIQDVKGKEWTFQFRFWPNNNSRMYVLEGVTPCIQNMQLQAGDTVMFSRIDPGEKLVMGFRKATSNADMQDAQTSSLPNGGFPGETSDSVVNDDLSTQKFEQNGGASNEDALQLSTAILEKKKTRIIGSKTKRLHMHSDDTTMVLRITQAEAQDLLRPSPTTKPTIVMIEDHEFEEYDEPPVFGKRTIFTAQPSGEQEQWGRCDCCSKWRRLPIDALLPPTWTCSDNIWDSKRCLCSAPEETKPTEIDSVLRIDKGSKKPRMPKTSIEAQEPEPTGLDALATAAVLGENIGDSGESSVGLGATTRHPRHRPGCSCIVCIQPPSGKGRHKPTCICNVCLTVKRRFKTLMLRKKKRQTEREADLAQEKGKHPTKDQLGTNQVPEQALPLMNLLENGSSQGQIQIEDGVVGSSDGQLDLNCDPDREDDMLAEAAGMSITSLLYAASLPWETYLRKNGLEYLYSHQAARNSDKQPQTEGYPTSANGEQESKHDEG